MATDITIDDVLIVNRCDEGNYVDIEFRLSWRNSFRTNIGDPAHDNWDAAWIFVKWLEVDSEEGRDARAWSHAKLRPDGHEVPAGFAYSLGLVNESDDWHGDTNPYVGIFVYRSHDNPGFGDVDSEPILLRWDYGSDGLEPTDLVSIQVFGIEMVYVAPGSFYVGDEGQQGDQYIIAGQFHSGFDNTKAYMVVSENSITLGGFHPSNIGNHETRGMFQPDDFSRSETKTLPAGYPKGYKPFYVMKHSVTQGAYVDFLNTLSADQAAERVDAENTGARHDIQIEDGLYVANNRHVPKNWTNWPDAAAYLAWAGLRPLTELEYEKAARGPILPGLGEYAWGTDTIVPAESFLLDSEEGEVPGNTDANAFFNHRLDGPGRVGAFATESSTREQAGASYWGIMELSGNVWEQVVSLGHPDGRSFTDLHGNGNLNAPGGNATVETWPGYDGGVVTGAAGSGLRGGHWATTSASRLRVADRYKAVAPVETRLGTTGFRGARTTSGLVVNTGAIAQVTEDSAQSGGIVHDDGGLPVTARGIVWNTNETTRPTIDDNTGMTEDGDGTGVFTSTLDNLDPEVGTYYIRAYATNDLGTAYGDVKLLNLPQKPTVETGPYIPINPSDATLYGLVNPNHYQTDLLYFEWRRTIYSGGSDGGGLATPPPPEALEATNVQGRTFQANWTEVAGAVSYTLDVSTQDDFVDFVDGYHAKDDEPGVETQTLQTTPDSVSGSEAVVVSAVLKNIDINQSYEYRIVAGNEAGVSYGQWREIVWWCGHDITFSYNGQQVVYGTIEKDYEGLGRLCWLDRNLGASQVATASDDHLAYGDLFQWGRDADGHQVMDWLDSESANLTGTTSDLADSDTPGHGSFIVTNQNPYDWRNDNNNNRWQAYPQQNNPCPAGWRVPYPEELEAEVNSWDSTNAAGAFGSELKWPAAGRRHSEDGALGYAGRDGNVWTASVDGTNARYLYFNPINTAVVSQLHRAFGRSVRCVMDIGLPAPETTGAARCGEGTVELVATLPAGANTARWYDSPTDGTLLDTGTSFSPDVSETTTYYVSSYNSNTNAESAERTAVTATVHALPGPATAVDGSRCGSGTVAISVSSVPPGSTIDWYATATGGTVLDGGFGTTSFTTPSISETTVYYAETRNTSTGCVSSSRTAVTAMIHYIPVDVTVTGGGSYCGGFPTLYAHGVSHPDAVYWQTSADGTSTDHSGFTKMVFSSGTWYARARSAAGCWGNPSDPATVTINTIPPIATAVDGERCGEGSVEISVTGVPEGTTIDWYATASGGTVLSGGEGTTSFTTPSISLTTTYYAQTRDTSTGCVSGSRTEVTATVKPTPTDVTVSGGGTQCGGSRTLTASGGPEGMIYWQTSADGTATDQGAGESKTVSSSGTWYARSLGPNGCWGNHSGDPATVTINAIPPNATAVHGSRCGEGSVEISVTDVPEGTTIDWYDTATGGTVLSGGEGTTSFTTPSISQLAVYYAETRDVQTGCVSTERVEVGAVVLNLGEFTEDEHAEITDTQIRWRWNSSQGASGYKWHTVDDFDEAMDLGNSTSHYEMNLDPGTPYTRYVWAYTELLGTTCTVPLTISEGTIPSPVSITGGSGTFCGSSTLTATGGTGGTIYWQNSPDGTMMDLEGPEVEVEQGGTWWARAYSPDTQKWGLPSEPPAIVVMGWIPDLATAVDGARCEEGPVAISVTDVPEFATIDWYDTPDGGDILDGGHGTTTFTTPVLSETTVYYAETRELFAGCVSAERTAVTATVVAIPDPPAEGSHDEITHGQIRWQWGESTGATGYKWHTVADFDAAIDKGTATNHTESDLTPGESYTRYAWAYRTQAGVTCQSEVRSLSATTASYNDDCGIVTHAGITYGTIERGGLCWLDRNLGAARVPLSSDDQHGYGDLYQWGRLTDGHELRTSGITTSLSSTDNPGHDNFIPAPEIPYDWRHPQNHNLWQGVSGINNPCPPGWRVPDQDELYEEQQSWGSQNSAGAYGSTLRWPKAGYRASHNGTLTAVGTHGFVWSSSVAGNLDRMARYLGHGDNTSVMVSVYRSHGMSVRCVRGINIPAPEASGDARCGAGTVELVATLPADANTARWYNSPTGGTPLHTGTSFSPAVSETTTYYVSAYNDHTSVESAERTAVVATVHALPGLATAVGGARCGEGPVTISVTNVPEGATIDWYPLSIGGSVLSGGYDTHSYTTPSLPTSNVYHAESRDIETGCVSDGRTAVMATVVAIPDPPAEGSHDEITHGQIRWQWGESTGATGYKWHAVDDFNTAIDKGTETNHTESDLTPGESYTRYAWAYRTQAGVTCQSEVRSLSATTASYNDDCGIVTHAGITYGTIERGGLCWLDRNLGATQVCETMDDQQCYGDLYQWGRGTDGHEKRNSNITYTLSGFDVPGHPDFILTGPNPGDWRSPQNNQLWQGVSGINNPCPPGWRLPLEEELHAERESWTTSDASGAIGSSLKWPVAGWRDYLTDNTHDDGIGYMWSSDLSGTNATYLYIHDFSGGGSALGADRRAYGLSVRCVRGINIPAPEATGAARCGAGTVELVATLPADANTARWYDSPTGGTLLHTGTSFSPYMSEPYVYETTTYYVSSYNSNTNSESAERTAVEATVVAARNRPDEFIHDHITFNQVRWRWSDSSFATGYKWNTVDDFNTAIDKGTATNHTESDLTPLESHTRYVWAYRTQAGVTCQSEARSLSAPTTLFTFIDSRDNQEYKGVYIGDQIWMAENLKYLPSVTGPRSEWNSQSPRYAVYDYEDPANSVEDAKATDNFANYGVLYNWYAVIQDGDDAICPPGWSVPGDEDWKQLEMHAGLTQAEADEFGWRGTDQGRKLKSARFTSPDGHPGWMVHESAYGTDDYRFTAYPGGHRDNLGRSMYRGRKGVFWTSSERTDEASWNRSFDYNQPGVRRGSANGVLGFSVRCIMDLPPPPPEALEATNVQGRTFQANWTEVDGAVSYILDVSTQDDFVDFVYGYQARDVGDVTHAYVIGLATNTTYYYRVRALLQGPTDYSNVIEVTTTEGSMFTFIDSRDNQEYKAVYIGEQTWMAENLNWVPTNDFGGGFGCYNNTTSNCDTYGRLYSWPNAMQGESASSTNPSGVQGVCPPGWHLPSDDEWKQLEMHLGMTSSDANNTGYRYSGSVGTKLKATSADSPGWDGTDTEGFSALPGGLRYHGGSTFDHLGSLGYWWSATESGANAWRRNLLDGVAGPGRFISDKWLGFSVRCVKDIQVGDPLGGGIVFYVSEDLVLIAAESDQSASTQWHDSHAQHGGSAVEIGTGYDNTYGMPDEIHTITTARTICADLSLNGYDDWFLPSRDELNQLYNQRMTVGRFTGENYWSSSEFYINTAWDQNFNHGGQNMGSKHYNARIRCIRAL